MKKLAVLILALIAVGGFAEMTKEQIKQKIFTDAQDKNATMVKSEREGLFKERLIKVRGFSQDEIIQMAIEYRGKYPINAVNGLDEELRMIAIQGKNYFTGYQTDYTRQVEENIKKAQEEYDKNHSFLDELKGGLGMMVDKMPWWGWALIGIAGVSLVGGLLKSRRD